MLTTHGFFWQTLDAHGARPALIDEAGQCINHAALAAAADAAGFAGLPRQLVLLELGNDVASIAAYLGALRAGHAVLLVNRGNEAVAGFIQQFCVSLHWRDGVLGETGLASPALHADLAVLLSTSGSTGSAKLVRLSASAVHANAASIADYLTIEPSDRAITSLPPAYSYGLSVLHSHLLAGASIALTDRSVVDPKFVAFLGATGATSIACVPYTVDLLERSGVLANLPPSLRTITQAGGRLAPERVAALAELATAAGIRFFVMYGQTEATARIAYLPPHLAPVHPDCIGVAVPGGRLWLRDPDTLAPATDTGELVYAGPNVMMGYAQHPDMLAEGPALTELATGDLAERLDNGIFRITGRLNRFVKMFGLRIALDEVERHLAADGIAAVAAGDDERIVLALTGDVPAGLAARTAARYGIPESRVVTMSFDVLPRLDNGKPDYRQIVAAAAPEPDKGDAAGANAEFEAYRRVVARLSPGGVIDPRACFADLAGDSLRFVEAGILLEGAIPALPQTWHRMPFADLARLAGQPGPERRQRGTLIGPDTLVRTAAILLVTIGHGVRGDVIKGGSDVLLLLAGYTLARLGSDRLFAGDGGRIVLGSFYRIAPAYYGLLAIAAAYMTAPAWYQWVLAGNYFNDPDLPFLWFVAAWLQCLACFGLLFAVPTIRRLATREPAAFALGLVIGAAALKGVSTLWLDPEPIRFRNFEQVLFYFAGGWALHFATGPGWRLAVIALMTIGSLATWGLIDTHGWVMLAATLFLMFGPAIALPGLIARPVQLISIASVYIYIIGILPTIVLWSMKPGSVIERAALVPIHLAATLALGIGAWWVIQWAERRLHSLRRSGRQAIAQRDIGPPQRHRI